MAEKRKEYVSRQNMKTAEECGGDSRDSSSCGTPAGSSSAPSSHPVSREHTPKPGQKPKFVYSRDDLMKLKESPLSLRRHASLPDDHFSEDGICDLDKWFRSFDQSSSGSSPVGFVAARERKRPSDLSRDVYDNDKRRASDPKARVKEEEEEGIILSPQRRSFGTGCHVTAPSLGRRPPSPNDIDGRDRRRIGSGRLNLSHSDREFPREGRGGRFGEGPPRDLGTRETLRENARLSMERERVPGNRGYMGRREDRQAGGDRDYGDRRYDRRREMYGRRQSHEEAEPEWFSGGPTSQSDTIELRGFEPPAAEEERMEQLVEENEATNQQEEQQQFEPENEHPEENPPENNTSVEDQPNESEPPQQLSQEQSVVAPKIAVDGQRFDLNDLFSINLPGLSDVGGPQEQPGEVIAPASAAGSRFSQWFHQQQGQQQQQQQPPPPPQQNAVTGGSSEHSRRSSLTDDFNTFSYLNDLIREQRSPAVSPPMENTRLFSPPPPLDKRPPQNLLDMLNHSKANVQPLLDQAYGGGAQAHQAFFRPPPRQPDMNSNMDANLKALLMSASNQQANANKAPHPHGQPPPSSAMTAAELEASLMSAAGNSSTPVADNGSSRGGGHNHEAAAAAGENNFKLSKGNEWQKAFLHQPPGASGLLPHSAYGLRPSERMTVIEPPNTMGRPLLGARSAGIDSAAANGPSTGRGFDAAGGLRYPVGTNPLSVSDPAGAAAGAVGPAVGLGSRQKVTTVSELEASLRQNDLLGQHTTPPSQLQQPKGMPMSAANSEHSTTDLSAFNRLLDMLQSNAANTIASANAHLQQQQQQLQQHQQQQMHHQLQQQQQQQHLQQQLQQRKSQTSPLGGMQLTADHMALLNANKQKDMIQKLMQYQQQQQQAAKKLHQQQAAAATKLKQQQQQNQQLQEQIFKLMQPGGGSAASLLKTASPIAPGLGQLSAGGGGGLQPPGPTTGPSPRCPSPLLQPPASPRAPSPIMFGSQPPMHLTAPSPIHPGSGLQSPLSPNTLQVNQGNPALKRVPSPQELIVHTQAIMQSALIKKQLEDQKERFMKRQQSKSPAPMGMPNMGQLQNSAMVVNSTAGPANALGSKQEKSFSPAFTPTSVIRKMANDKMEERDKAEGDTPPLIGSDGTIIIPVPQLPIPTSANSGPGSIQQQLQEGLSKGPGGSGLSDPSNNNAGNGSKSMNVFPGQPPHQQPRAITGNYKQDGIGLSVATSIALNNQHSRPIMGAGGGRGPAGPSPNLGRSNAQMGQLPGGVSVNSLLMQQMMRPGIPVSSSMGGLTATASQQQQQQQQQQLNHQLNQLMAMQQAAAAAQQAQQRQVDPRVRGLYPNVSAAAGHHHRTPQSHASHMSNMAAAFGKAELAGSQMSPPSGRGGPMTSAPPPNFSMNALFAATSRSGGEAPSQNHLAKFFNADMLRQQSLPSMPPLHAQGQKVLTVDEIERREQTVTH